MKIRKILKVASIIVVILIVLLSVAVFYLSRPKTRYQFVSKAVLIHPQNTTDIPSTEAATSDTEWKEKRRLERSRCIDILQKNHSIQTASGISLIIDFYSPGKLNMIDAGTYRRLTISIKEPEVNRIYDTTKEEILVYYSSGGTAWVMHCAGYYANAASGTIILTKMDKNKIKVKMDLHGKAVHAHHPGEEQDFSFGGNYVFHAANIDKINSWAGRWDEFTKDTQPSK